MIEVLKHINSVPGVVGSMVCDEGGQLIADAFPSTYKQEDLEGIAALVGESSFGLQSVDGSLNMLDIRYNDYRILVRPLSHCFLFLLCQKTINLHFLALTLNIALKRLEKKLEEIPSSQHIRYLQAFQANALVIGAEPIEKEIILTTELLKIVQGDFWSSKPDVVAVNNKTTQDIKDKYKIDIVTQLKLTNPSKGISKSYSVRIIADDKSNKLDGKIIVSQVVLDALKAKAGDKLVCELKTSDSNIKGDKLSDNKGMDFGKLL